MPPRRRSECGQCGLYMLLDGPDQMPESVQHKYPNQYKFITAFTSVQDLATLQQSIAEKNLKGTLLVFVTYCAQTRLCRAQPKHGFCVERSAKLDEGIVPC